jgi:anaerobic selenocysteine-containing dehydrogenase
MGSVGVTPKLKHAVFERLESHFGIRLPTAAGLDTISSLRRAYDGGIRFAWCLGGNLYGASPDSRFARQAFANTDLVVYMSTSLNTGHVWGRGRETIILPVLARDEEPQKTTQESMFNYVRLSDGGMARHQGPRAEVSVIADVARRVFGDRGPIDWQEMQQHASIRAAIAKIVPGYERIGEIEQSGSEFHVRGRTLHSPHFATASGKAHFHAHAIPKSSAEPNELRLMTIRSEGQFNTVVFEDEDIYRGQERRDVILMNAQDIERLGLEVDDRVTVRSQAGVIQNVFVREYQIRSGNAAMYYPEANVLVPAVVDPQSMTPAFKSVRVSVERGRFVIV